MKKLIDPEKLKECYTGHNGLDDKASYESIRRMIDIQPNALDLEPLWNLYEKYVRKTAELDVTDADIYKSADSILEYTSRNGMATGILRCLELLSGYDNYMEVQKRSFDIYCKAYGHPEFAERSFSSYQEKQQTTECQDNEEFEY